MAITKEQYRAANKRGQATLAHGPVARAARYDPRSGRVVITLNNQCEFAFPAALAQGLAGAPASRLSRVEVSPSGLGLHWPLLDADLYVPSLLEGILGSRQWMQHIGKLGGKAKSAAKAKASRENGKKGGRPKERLAA